MRPIGRQGVMGVHSAGKVWYLRLPCFSFAFCTFNFHRQIDQWFFQTGVYFRVCTPGAVFSKHIDHIRRSVSSVAATEQSVWCGATRGRLSARHQWLPVSNNEPLVGDGAAWERSRQNQSLCLSVSRPINVSLSSSSSSSSHLCVSYAMPSYRSITHLGDSDVISSYQLFSAILWGKLCEMLVSLTSVDVTFSIR